MFFNHILFGTEKANHKIFFMIIVESDNVRDGIIKLNR